MDITKSNYSEKIPEIKEAIDNATFLAIDCELTGLNTVSDVNAYDTQKQYFEKVRGGSKDFLIVQFGLCIFRYEPEDNSFKHQTYNFYVFPRHINKHVPDQRFLCQASSIDFLVSHGFDFNKLFREGIPYLNSQQEARYREILEEGRAARAKLLLSPQTLNMISVPEEDKPTIDKYFEDIEDFIKSNEVERVLPKCNAFVRRLIYQTARGRIDDRASLETRRVENNERALVVTRPKGKEERDRDEKNRMREDEDKLQEAIGFSEIMTYISGSGKLIIGHNMMLDVCHSIDKFLTPLPSDYESFKECVHCVFPKIIDTKYMSSSGPFKDLINSTVLAHLVNSISKEPFSLPDIEPEDNFPTYSLNEAKEHEAGYDAYITGLAFIAMWNYLGKQKRLKKATFECTQLLSSYLNRLFLMRIQDAPYIQLDGDDPTPSRDHVFYLSFPKDWKLNDIMQLFSPFGNVYVSWINECSAYIALHKREQANFALTALSQSNKYTIMTYAQRQAQLGNQMGSPVVKKQLPLVKCKKRKSSTSGECVTLKKKAIASEKSSDEEKTSEAIPCLIKPPRKRTISKTFQEDSSWD